MKYIFVVLIICGYFIYKDAFKSSVKNINFTPINQFISDAKIDQKPMVSKCLSFNKCLVVYVAPWCPACHEFLEKYPAIQKKLNERNIGTLIVVGADENRSIEIDFRNQIGDSAVLDSSLGEFRKLNKIDLFPYFFVTDSSLKVLKYHKSAYQFISENTKE